MTLIFFIFFLKIAFIKLFSKMKSAFGERMSPAPDTEAKDHDKDANISPNRQSERLSSRMAGKSAEKISGNDEKTKQPPRKHRKTETPMKDTTMEGTPMKDSHKGKGEELISSVHPDTTQDENRKHSIDFSIGYGARRFTGKDNEHAYYECVRSGINSETSHTTIKKDFQEQDMPLTISGLEDVVKEGLLRLQPISVDYDVTKHTIMMPESPDQVTLDLGKTAAKYHLLQDIVDASTWSFNGVSCAVTVVNKSHESALTTSATKPTIMAKKQKHKEELEKLAEEHVLVEFYYGGKKYDNEWLADHHGKTDFIGKEWVKLPLRTPELKEKGSNFLKHSSQLEIFEEDAHVLTHETLTDAPSAPSKKGTNHKTLKKCLEMKKSFLVGEPMSTALKVIIMPKDTSEIKGDYEGGKVSGIVEAGITSYAGHVTMAKNMETSHLTCNSKIYLESFDGLSLRIPQDPTMKLEALKALGRLVLEKHPLPTSCTTVAVVANHIRAHVDKKFLPRDQGLADIIPEGILVNGYVSSRSANVEEPSKDGREDRGLSSSGGCCMKVQARKISTSSIDSLPISEAMTIEDLTEELGNSVRYEIKLQRTCGPDGVYQRSSWMEIKKFGKTEERGLYAVVLRSDNSKTALKILNFINEEIGEEDPEIEG